MDSGDMTLVWAHSPGDVCDEAEREVLQQCWKVRWLSVWLHCTRAATGCGDT